ncbi:MAG: hypothetical protein MJ124_05935 [Lachnospiraceae bacterium]|nr:hypothetical protein [Lachnospiraceae bacterium]
MNINFGEKRAKKVIWGVMFLLLVAGIIISALGLFQFPSLSVPAIIFTIIAVLMLIEGITSRNFFAIFMPAAILAICWRPVLGIPTQFNNWLIILCGVLLSFAFSLLFPGFKKSHKFNVNVNGTNYTVGKDGWKTEDGTEGSFKNNEYVTTSPENNAEVTFGAQVKYYKSQEFQNANLEANFGNIKAYFTDAKMRDTSAHINVDCNFGNVELFIPKEWQVSIENDGAFSGCNQTGEVQWDGIHTLYLDVDVNFGSLTIHHV